MTEPSHFAIVCEGFARVFCKPSQPEKHLITTG
jgi:hypothetical protein